MASTFIFRSLRRRQLSAFTAYIKPCCVVGNKCGASARPFSSKTDVIGTTNSCASLTEGKNRSSIGIGIGLCHQLVQRRWVSGTAKGKGKIKSGQTLKRSKVTTKKSGDAASSTGGPRKKSEFDELVDQCLTSSSPLRFMKPKEKAREAEREKMGLISQANKQAKDNLNKKKNENDNDNAMGTPGMDLISLGFVDADKIPKYQLTVEDGRTLAKEYSRVLMRKHRARQAAETTLLRFKKEAIEALPDQLKAAALIPDLAPFPVNRFMATLTPPIEGYIDKINEAAKRSAAKEKLR